MTSRRAASVGLAFCLIAQLVFALAAPAPSASAQEGQAGYTPLVPARVLDTRVGIGAPVAKVGPDTSLSIAVTGVGGVPTSGVAAVALNITVTEPTESSFVTVWPSGVARPTASSLNMVAGQSIPNLVIAQVGVGGQVSLYNFAGNTDLIADVVGWFGTAGDFEPLVPARLIDTRSGLGAPAAPIGPASSINLQVTGKGGVPANVDSVIVNMTVTDPTSGSFVTVWPAGQRRPTASNLNMEAGETFANLVIAKVGNGGNISIYNHLGSTNIVADVVGYFPATDDEYTGLTPARLLDTREGVGAPEGPVAGTASISLDVLGRGGVPADAVSAVVLNVTVTEPSEPSFVTVWPTGSDRPVASHLNMVAGQTVPNLVIAKVGAGGTVDLYNHAGTTHLIADVVGYFAEPGVITEPGPPSPPVAVVAVGGDTTITANWSPPLITGGSPITGYIVTLAPTGQTQMVTEATATFTGLGNGTEYVVKVAAQTAFGIGEFGSSAAVTPIGDSGTLLISNSAAEVPWLAADPALSWDYTVECGMGPVTLSAAADGGVAFGPLPMGTACAVTQLGAIPFLAGGPIGAPTAFTRPGPFTVDPAHTQDVTIGMGTTTVTFANTRFAGNGPGGNALDPIGCPASVAAVSAPSWAYCNWSGVTMAGAVITGGSLAFGNFVGVAITGLTFSGTNFGFIAGNSFTMVGFSGTGSFIGADLTSGVFNAGSFSDGVGVGSDFSQANLTNASFIGTDLRFSTLVGADLGGANLSSALMGSANLSGASLAGATAVNAGFSTTNLTNVDASGANFTGAKMTTATIAGMTWTGATCPDGTAADDEPSGTCAAHLALAP